MAYSAPGFADNLPVALKQEWNKVVKNHFDQLAPDFGSRFFAFDPATVVNPLPVPSLKWFANPAEPVFCQGQTIGRKLSDWNWTFFQQDGTLEYHGKARELLHNEYCEYVTVMRQGADGRFRPKRVIVTTELREYWVCLAMHDPNFMRQAITNMIGTQPTWEELYGVADPFALSLPERERLFSTLVAGNGNDQALQAAGVPNQPTGELNRRNALFMTHPINGLDDLFYIVMFGAHPYAQGNQNAPQKATREQIFREFGVAHLACRHADPAAAMGAHEAAFVGKTVSFADPLGMYLASFNDGAFTVDGGALPASWIRFSRGSGAGLFQRLEFGPPDNDPRFLRDIALSTGGALEDGFQIVEQIEVGPRAIVSTNGTPVAANEFAFLTASGDPIVCGQAQVCQRVAAFKAQYDTFPHGEQELAGFSLVPTPNQKQPKKRHRFRQYRG